MSKAIQQWLSSLEVRTLYVAPGSPWQNGYAESFHSRLRDTQTLLTVTDVGAAIADP